MQPGENSVEIEQRLKRERQRLEERIRRLEEEGLSQSLRDSLGELSAYDNHSPDLGSETFERSKDLGLLDNLRLLLRRIDQALERLQEGRYGLCVRCGRPIDPLRLAALPYAVRCLECEEVEEKERAPRPRPVEEEVLGVPFARSFREEGDNNAFDGEDAWQAVARFGTSNSPQDVPDAISVDDAVVNADEDIGIVEEVEGLVDLTQGEEEQQSFIYPEPADAQRRWPHRQAMRGTRPDPTTSKSERT